MMKFYLREFVENKLPKFYETIFSLVKAKNVGIAGLRRGFSTRNKGKRVHKMGRLYFTSSLTAILLCFALFQLSAAPRAYVNEELKTTEKTEEVAKKDMVEKWKNFSAKKKAKLQKRIEKMKTKMQKRAAGADTSGIKLGLVILLIGVIIAVLGLAGVADLLITIGIIVLAVGLVLWLINKL
ncbi:MAG: hypothetical protein AAGI49_02585 [Bacteroidota bacterium]